MLGYKKNHKPLLFLQTLPPNAQQMNAFVFSKQVLWILREQRSHQLNMGTETRNMSTLLSHFFTLQAGESWRPCQIYILPCSVSAISFPLPPQA